MLDGRVLGKPIAFHFHVIPDWPHCVPTAPPAHVLLPAVEASMDVSTQWGPRKRPCHGYMHTCDPTMESETQGHTNDCRNWYLELCCAVAWKNDVVLQHVFRTCHIVSSRRWTAPKKNHDGCMLTMLQRKNIFWELSGWTECRNLYEYVWTWTFLHPKTFN